jgi:hypothetical protein
MRASQALIGAAAAVLVAGLAGCAPDPVPTETPVAEATPTPTPTAIQEAAPVSALPLGCEDLLPLDAVREQYVGDTLSVSVNQDSTPRGWYQRSYAQAGGLRCVWAGSGRTDGGYDIGLELLILGGGAADYTAQATSPDQPDVEWTDDAYGDASHTSCYSYVPDEGTGGDPLLQCYGDILVGEYWLEFRMSDSGHPLTEEQADAWAEEQLTPVVDAIGEAGPARPQWAPPADALSAAELCDDAAATSVVGSPVTVSHPAVPESTYQVDVGSRRADLGRCVWKTGEGLGAVHVVVLTGGAWALPGMNADLAEVPGILGGDAQPIEVDGADGAFVADGETAWGALVIGGSVVELSTEASYDGADLIPLLTQLASFVTA